MPFYFCCILCMPFRFNLICSLRCGYIFLGSDDIRKEIRDLKRELQSDQKKRAERKEKVRTKKKKNHPLRRTKYFACCSQLLACVISHRVTAAYNCKWPLNLWPQIFCFRTGYALKSGRNNLPLYNNYQCKIFNYENLQHLRYFLTVSQFWYFLVFSHLWSYRVFILLHKTVRWGTYRRFSRRGTI
jgi:hypothetical protein